MVVCLPLHCWSGEVFKKIGDYCGGFVEVDVETKRFSQVQLAIMNFGEDTGEGGRGKIFRG